jgi:hypothetical protein
VVFYICLALTGVICLGTIAYFPSVPPTPPSASAAHQKEEEKGVTWRYVFQSITTLFSNPAFLLLFLGAAPRGGRKGCRPGTRHALSLPRTLAG